VSRKEGKKVLISLLKWPCYRQFLLREIVPKKRKMIKLSRQNPAEKEGATQKRDWRGY